MFLIGIRLVEHVLITANTVYAVITWRAIGSVSSFLIGIRLVEHVLITANTVYAVITWRAVGSVSSCQNGIKLHRWSSGESNERSAKFLRFYHQFQ